MVFGRQTFIVCQNEQNIAYQTREQKKCFFEINGMFDGLLIISSTTKHDQTRSGSSETRCIKGKMFGHQTIFDGTCLVAKGPRLILRRSRSFAFVTCPFPSSSDGLGSRPCSWRQRALWFYPIKANVTVPLKWEMRGMWLCKEIEIQDDGKSGRRHRESLRVFGVSKLFPELGKAFKTFIDKNDVLLNLPTGFGKSLVFQMAPLVQSGLSTCDGFAANPIVVVIFPLLSLMEDQTNFFAGSGNLGCFDKRRRGCQREDRERRVLCKVYLTWISVGKWSVEEYVVFGH